MTALAAEGAGPLAGWLPPGRRAAVCFSLDDVHPARSCDHYEAGGDLSAGVLGRLERLLDRHPLLRATLFVTPDWRMLSPYPTRRRLARLPGLGRRLYQAPRLPRGRMRLDRHPEFARYLAALPRTEVALHGLHHVHPGPRLAVEFQRQGRRRCAAMLRRGLDICRRARLEPVPGFQPPGWELPPALVAGAGDVGLAFVVAARDLVTPISPGAVTAMSGPRGLSLLHPHRLGGGAAAPLLHFATNFQATSEPARARAVIEAGGLLSIKAHAVKQVMEHTQLDGLDTAYGERLDRLFGELEERYGEGLWWTSFGELAARLAAPG